MMSDPWLTVIGIGEDGPAGLTDASRLALTQAQVIFGGPRHLELVGAGDKGQPWPVPFSVEPVLARRGAPCVVLVSGDPFWFGAGGSLARHVPASEMRVLGAPSTFSLAAARLGWRLEESLCFGLHAAPLQQLRPVLAPGQKVLALMRDAAAVGALAEYLCGIGFGGTRMTVLEALGGPRERIRSVTAADFALDGIQAPVAVALSPDGPVMPRACGLDDALFSHDNQITKRPVRAITLSSLAPRPGEHLWDLGAGSGAVSVEWCLAAPGATATAVERRKDRLDHVARNVDTFGLGHRITQMHGDTGATLPETPPDAVFIGGGCTAELLDRVWAQMPAGARLVVNAVTLETQALVSDRYGRHGGDLMQIAISDADKLGGFHGWRPARPVVQWSVIRCA